MKKYIYGLLYIILVFSVSGQGLMPLHFYGDITVNGEAAPDDLIVSVKINGQDVGSETTLNGIYGMEPAEFLIVTDISNGNPGAVIELFVNDDKAYEMLMSEIDEDRSTRIDLDVDLDECGDGSCSSTEDCASCPTDCGECTTETGGSGGSSGGSSGGGSSGGSSPVITGPTEVTEEVCEPDWQCSEWTACVNNIQKRTCVDANKCNTDEGKPELEQGCTAEELPVTRENIPDNRPQEPSVDENSFDFITGFVINDQGQIKIVPILGIIFVIVVIVFIYYRRKI